MTGRVKTTRPGPVRDLEDVPRPSAGRAFVSLAHSVTMATGKELLFVLLATLAVTGAAPTEPTTAADCTTHTEDNSTTEMPTTTPPTEDPMSADLEDTSPFPLPPDCFVDCPTDMPPVCGTDKRVYDSECHLVVSNCRYQDNVTAGDWEECRGLHPLCPTNCLSIYDPVCGQDGKIYPNLCVMHSNNCGKTMRLEDLQFCLSKAREFREYDPCPRQCQEVYEPVCSSTGQVFTNECFMRLYTCGQGVKMVEMEKCVKTPQCPVACTPIYDPVCGSDGRVYLNHCRFSQANCGKRIEQMPRKFCEEKLRSGTTSAVPS